MHKEIAMPTKTPSSKAKQASSRANGAKSQGPVTPEGKARASRNNLQHGLLSRDMVLPTEDAGAITAMHARLIAQLNPANELEVVLAKTMSMALLHLNRVWDVQAAAQLNEVARHSHLSGVQATLKAMDTLLQPGQAYPLYRRYQITHERSMYRALNQLISLREKGGIPPPCEFLPFEPENPPSPPPATTCGDGDPDDSTPTQPMRQ